MSKLSARSYDLVVASKVIRVVYGRTPSFLIEDEKGDIYNVRGFGAAASGNHPANQSLGSLLARIVGLPIAEAIPIYLSRAFLDQWLLDAPDALGTTTQPGLQCGTRLLGDLAGPGRAFEHLNSADLKNVRNQSDFAGFHLFEQWAGNLQPLRPVFLRSHGTRELHAYFVDSGLMFMGGCWDGLSTDFRPELNTSTSLIKPNEQAMRHWAIKLQSRLPTALATVIPSIPREWYTGDLAGLHSILLRRLDSFSVLRDDSSNVTKPYSSLSSLRLHLWRNL